MIGILYLITNKITLDRYVGQTTSTLDERWKEHCWKSNKCIRLRNAIQKYGPDAFEIKIIARCDTIEQMNHRETYYITKIFKTLSPNGYNLNTGGNNCLPSEETRKKQSEAKKGLVGKKHPRFGKSHTEKSKRQMSESKKGMFVGEKNPNFGKKASEETRRKNSKSHKGKMTGPLNPNFGKYPKMAEANKIKIICLTTGEKFNSLTEAANKYNILTSKISKVCKLQQRHVHGLVFRYIGEEHLVFQNKKRGTKKGMIPHNRKPVILVELNITFEHIQEAMNFCIKNNRATNRAAIRRAANGIYKTAAGYHWRFP